MTIVALLLLAALVVGTTYWQAWAVGGLAARQDNAIQRVAQFHDRRGLIYAADGELLAARRAVEGQGQTYYFRRYPTRQARRAGRRLLDAVALAGRARALARTTT